ncbi:MAG: botulinum neurotoxin N-terminal receptor binding domain-containing protein, partial [Bacteroidota bacterium]
MTYNKIFFIVGWMLLFAGCDMSEYDLPDPDDRLLGVEVEFSHVDPRTGENLINVFENLFRNDDEVQISVTSTKTIERIEVVNSLSASVISTINVNGTSADFSYSVADMDIPFGESGNLVFHLYYDDAGEDGFDFPSIQSYSFRVISDVPSIVNFKSEDGTVTELRTSDVNIDGFSEDPDRGIVASFKGDENSFLEIENSPLLEFGATQNFSISFWIQSDHDISDPAMMGTMDWVSSGNVGWLIAWRNGRIRVVAGNGDGIKTDYSQPGDDPSMVGSDWHFITVTFDRNG